MPPRQRGDRGPGGRRGRARARARTDDPRPLGRRRPDEPPAHATFRSRPASSRPAGPRSWPASSTRPILRFGLALRLAPALAPAVLEATDGARASGLLMVRGDAYRLAGHEAEARRRTSPPRAAGCPSAAAGPDRARRAGRSRSRRRCATRTAGRAVSRAGRAASRAALEPRPGDRAGPAEPADADRGAGRRPDATARRPPGPPRCRDATPTHRPVSRDRERPPA